MDRKPRFPRDASTSGRGWIVAVALVAVIGCVVYFVSSAREAPPVEPEFGLREPMATAQADLAESSTTERAVAAPVAKDEPTVPSKPTTIRTSHATIRLLADGEPLQHGRVVLQLFGGPRIVRDIDAGTRKARFADLRPGNYDIDLEAIPDGWVVTRAASRDRDANRHGEEIEVRFGENEFDLELEPGAVVHGIVYDERGWPEDSARVRISSREPRERSVPARDVLVKGGEFVAHVHEGSSLIEVVNVDPRRRRIPPPAQTVTLAVGARADLEFRFSSGGETFAGRVVDETGAPFEGLSVTVSIDDEMIPVPGAAPTSGPLRRTLTGAKTDAEGRFAFEGLPRGTCTVRIEEKGVSPFEGPRYATVARIQTPRTVELPITEPWVVTIERAHPVLVRGHVLVQGKRWTGSIDAVIAPGERRTVERRQDFQVDPDGSFTFYVDGGEKDVVVELKHEGRVVRVPIPLSVSAGEVRVDVPLP